MNILVIWEETKELTLEHIMIVYFEVNSKSIAWRLESLIAIIQEIIFINDYL